MIAFDGQNVADCGDVSATLDTAGAKGNRGMHVAYRTAGDGGIYEEGDVSAPLTTATDKCANIIAIQERAICDNPDAGPDGAGFRDDGQAYTLEARANPQAVAFDLAQLTHPANRSRVEDGLPTGSLSATSQMHVASGAVIRKFTPRECERLQGIPDDFTLVPYRGGMMKDGPRYIMIGNSQAVPVMRWIGERMEMVEQIIAGRAA